MLDRNEQAQSGVEVQWMCLIVVSMFYGSTMRQTAIRIDVAEIVEKKKISRSVTDPVSVCCANTIFSVCNCNTLS